MLLKSVENFNGVRSIGNRFRALISTGMMRPSWKERVGDALALGGEEGRARLRKVRGSCQRSIDPGIPE